MRPRAKGTGSVYKMPDSRYFWISYQSGGRRHYESTKSERKQDAQDLLTSRLGDVGRGIVVTPKVGKITIGTGLTAVVNDLKMNGRQSARDTQRGIDKHILPFFPPERRMNTITTSDLTAYVTHRQAQGAAAASVNHELSAIRRAYKLALRGGELVNMPHVPMLHVDNARRGFMERHELLAILKHLPTYLHGALQFAFITGWRLKSEVLPLTVDHVDLRAGVVRLDPGTTKNREGRSFYVTSELRDVLTAQLQSIEALQRQGTICPYVFHHPDGSRLRDFRGLWRRACVAAGYPGKLFHDFRRSAVRTLERSGVPRSTAMAMVGHKTESIYRRYAIVDSAMQQEAAAKLDAWAEEQQAKAPTGQLQQFAAKR